MQSILPRALGALLLALAPGLRAAENASSVPAASPGYEFRAEHDPNGIGKFFQGREIAHVMGHEAAYWLERADRDAQESSEKLVDLLGFKPGDAVADIGAGTGYHTRRIAKRLTAGGRVYAVDIQPEMLQILTNGTVALGLTNVVAVLGTLTDPNLPPASIDCILMVDVYHELSHPYEMMTAMCRALKPGGRVVFVEFRAEDPKVPIKRVHEMSEAQVKKEMSLFPLQWEKTLAQLPWQHVIVFRRR